MKNNYITMLATVIMLTLLFLIKPPALAKNYQGKPGTFVPLGFINISGLGTRSEEEPTDQCLHGSIMLTSTINGSPTSVSYPTNTTIDNYTGILINGLLYVLYNGSMTTENKNRNNLSNGIVKFNANGQTSTGGSTYQHKNNCWTTNVATHSFANSKFSVTLNTGIYIPKNYTASGIVNLENVYVGNANLDSSYINTSNVFFKEDTLEIRAAPIICRVSAPPTINFDIVNSYGTKADTLLATNQEGIYINCSSSISTAKTNVKISFTNGYSSNYSGYINMLNKENQNMAYIRGRYLNTTTGRCSPDSINEVSFNDSANIKNVTNVGVGRTHIPIAWSLCSNGSGLLGKGNAKAIMTMTWE